jgi:hypothetical protein
MDSFFYGKSAANGAPRNNNFGARASVVNAVANAKKQAVANAKKHAVNARKRLANSIKAKHEGVNNTSFRNKYAFVKNTLYPYGNELNYFKYDPFKNVAKSVWEKNNNFTTSLQAPVSNLERTVNAVKSAKAIRNARKSARRTRKNN